ncbi:D-glycerate 3-kinase, chloroplastic isoform X2 [Nymphaea colorata]|uniref:D-glycerate 3-kinase, chloroplastic isoform X2 n=1 Tax=Nymphaea colorata TaxID=210225 RepID=UPI00129D717F|nr:D-glycerate 3-kinase, chloroplastic isoform X2 [Nymphaea colorata]
MKKYPVASNDRLDRLRSNLSSPSHSPPLSYEKSANSLFGFFCLFEVREVEEGMVGLSVLCHHHHLPCLPSEWSISTSATTSSHSCSFHSRNHLASSFFSLHRHDVQRPSWSQGLSLYCNNFIRSNGRELTIPRSTFSTTPAMVAAVHDLFDFICSGPLMSKLGLTQEIVTETIDRWLEYGSHLCRLFGMNELDLPISDKIRIYHYYIPVFVWCQKEILYHKSKFKDGEQAPPLVIGISAPQGSGKTTLVYALNHLFQVTGRNSATLSIDDFYLKAEDQAKLRSENPGNSLLELRGNAGSHDLPFSVETLNTLRNLTRAGQKMQLPRYDKSAYGGKGDRSDLSTWPEVEGPLAVVLFEGWMLGFKPQPPDDVKAVDPKLDVVNSNLEAYYDAWDKFVDSWIVIKIKNPECVYQWRLEAEVAMRAAGKPGMSDQEVLDFVSRYMPAYKAYLPTLYSEGPRGADKNHLLVVEIDEYRNPVVAQ